MTQSIELAGGDYEHTLGLDGVYDGVKVNYTPGLIMDMFRRMISERAFETCEFSLSNYIGLKMRQADWLDAIPVFPNRNFRHGTLFVRADSDLTEPAQLRGGKIGVQEYTMTAAVWVRGFLHEQYGVHWKDLDWYCEARHKRVEAPASVRVTDVADDVEELLLAGALDAIIASTPKDEKRPPGSRRLRRLFGDYVGVEKTYYRDTGIFPINHCVVLREDVLKRIPASPRVLFNAYCASKKAAYQRCLASTMVPWARHHWMATFDFFGGDPLPYGLTDQNRMVVATLIRYVREQELIPDAPDASALFVQGSSEFLED